MKNLTTIKKSVLAITISLTIVLFAILLMTCISTQPNSVQKGNAFFAADINGGTSTNNLSQNGDAVGMDKDFYIVNSESTALLMAGVIFGMKSDVAEVTNMQFESSQHLVANNISQDYLNRMLELNYNIKASGTCSLVAMIIASDPLGIKDQIYKDMSEEEREIAIFKELYDIAVEYGSDYSAGGIGTSADNIPLILKKFYSNHGYYYDLNNIKLRNDLRKNVEEKRHEPSLISMNNGLDQDSGEEVAGHTVALLGSYKIKITYRKRGMLHKQNGTFNAFVICDGWKNSEDRQIGQNYQILLFNTNVANDVYLVNLM